MNSTNSSITIYPSNSCPYGITYNEWTSLWWKWLISIPKDKNPAMSTSGEFCGVSQHQPNVWFLAGTFGGSVTRSCKIPHGKAILFPIINYECSFADEPSIRSEKELELKCKIEIDDIFDVYAFFDGHRINVRKFRIRSQCFTVDVPPNNCIGVTSGVTRMASDGYWLFLESMPRGNHVLTSFGSCLSGKIKICCNFKLNIE